MGREMEAREGRVDVPARRRTAEPQAMYGYRARGVWAGQVASVVQLMSARRHRLWISGGLVTAVRASDGSAVTDQTLNHLADLLQRRASIRRVREAQGLSAETSSCGAGRRWRFRAISQ